MLTQKEQKLVQLIEKRREALLDDLRLHVGLPTGGLNVAAIDEARERFASRLTKLGATLDLIDGEPRPAWLDVIKPPEPKIPPAALLKRLDEESGRKRILIAGHLDTVHDPLGPFKELTVASDGKTARGPGCADMKGGLVIALAALEALEEAGLEASWTVLLNADEETGTFHSEKALRSEAARHDFGLAVEPALAGGELAIERMGSGQFMIEARGRSAHVGRSFPEGVSAVTALARALVALSAMPDASRGKIMSVGPLKGGAAANAVPDLARAWGNCRFPTREIADEIRADLQGMVTPEDAMPSIRLETVFNRPAKPLIPETEKLAEQAREVAESLGQALPFAKTGGVCDGNTMQDAGLPTIDTLGVRGGGLHTPDEWIELSSLVERCSLLAVLISRLSGN